MNLEAIISFPWNEKVIPVLDTITNVYLNRDTTKSLTSFEYMTAIITIRELCLGGTSHIQKISREKNIHIDPSEAITQFSICEHVYKMLTRYAMSVSTKELRKLMSKDTGASLKDYVVSFESYLSAMNIVKNISTFLTKTFIERDESFKHIKNRLIIVDNLIITFLRTWKTYCYDIVSTQLLNECLDLMEVERSGNIIDRNTVSLYLKSLSLLDTTQVDFFRRHFLEQFKESITKHYSEQCNEYMSNYTARDYMKRAEKSMRFEINDMYDYLAIFKSDITACMLSIFVSSNLDYLESEFSGMIHSDNTEDMKTFYYLVSKVSVESPAQIMGSLIFSLGTQIVADANEKLSKRSDIRHSHEFVDQMIALHSKYYGLCNDCFDRDVTFVKCMDISFRKFLNTDIGVFKMAEILNFYVDTLMKGTTKKSEKEIDTSFDHIVRIFAYIDDRDFFYKAFKRSLSKRLIEGNQKDHLEFSFVQKLKMAAGDAFTGSLESMYNDIRTSEETMDQFKEILKDTNQVLPVDFQAKVLSSFHWPIRKGGGLNIPDDALMSLDIFSNFYSTNNNRKQLLWCHDYGTVSLNHYCMDRGGKKRKVELIVSPLQASILMLFNDEKPRSFNLLKETLAITDRALKFGIAPLIYGTIFPVLKKTSESIKEMISKKNPKDQIIEDTDEFELCNFPKIEKMRVKYKPGTAQTLERESKDLKEQLMEERNNLMDLTLVRVMKSRKTLEMQILIEEASQQLLKLFTPNPKLMKKRIEHLIEREYMERDEENPRVLKYIA